MQAVDFEDRRVHSENRIRGSPRRKTPLSESVKGASFPHGQSPAVTWPDSCSEVDEPSGAVSELPEGMVMNVSSRKLLLLAVAAAVACIVGCSSESGSGGSSAPSGGGGTARVGGRFGRTTQFSKSDYTLTGPNGFSRTGTIDVRNQREAEGSILDIPAGSPYTLSLRASSTDGNVTCVGSKSGIAVTCPGNREQDE